MLGTGAILTEGTTTFAPVFGRLGEIVKEFIPYIIRIVIGYIGIRAVRDSVKQSMQYTEQKTKGTFGNKKYGKRRKKGKQAYYIKTKKGFIKVKK